MTGESFSLNSQVGESRLARYQTTTENGPESIACSQMAKTLAAPTALRKALASLRIISRFSFRDSRFGYTVGPRKVLTPQVAVAFHALLPLFSQPPTSLPISPMALAAKA